LSLQYLLPFIGTFGIVQVDVGPFVSGSPQHYSICYRYSGLSKMFINPILRAPMSHVWVSIALLLLLILVFLFRIFVVVFVSAPASASICSLSLSHYYLSMSQYVSLSSLCVFLRKSLHQKMRQLQS
jgi:hypothetical protein